MIIQLTQKDADFILKFIKADLTKANKNLDEIEAHYEHYRKSMPKDVKPEIAAIDSFIGNAKTIICEDTKDLCRDLEKCVELLTIGSEK